MGSMAYEFERAQRIAVLGGGPGGYEAAIAGAQLGAEVTLVERVRRMSGQQVRELFSDRGPSRVVLITCGDRSSVTGVYASRILVHASKIRG